jgi:hypothetical protein
VRRKDGVEDILGDEEQREVGDEAVQETAYGVAAEYAKCHV